MDSEQPQGRRAQRRHLTALFSDLSDSTALASSVDPEEFAELLEALNRTFEQIILRHGGTILQMIEESAGVDRVDVGQASLDTDRVIESTQAAIEHFESAGLRALVEGAMQAASDRAEEMAREMG